MGYQHRHHHRPVNNLLEPLEETLQGRGREPPHLEGHSEAHLHQVEEIHHHHTHQAEDLHQEDLHRVAHHARYSQNLNQAFQVLVQVLAGHAVQKGMLMFLEGRHQQPKEDNQQE